MYNYAMKSEIEAKFLRVDFDAIRERLTGLGAQCKKPMRQMTRATIDYPDRRLQSEKDAFIRVRDEGDKVTLTYKQFAALSVDGAKELEVVVSGFQDTVAIFEAIGMKVKSLQETRRETWELNGVEIMLGEWPWLQPYIEIEGGSEAAVKSLAEQLGLDWEAAVFGDVMAAYRAQYPYLSMTDTVAAIPSVRFGDPLPKLLG